VTIVIPIRKCNITGFSCSYSKLSARAS